MTAAEVLSEVETLTSPEKARVISEVIRSLTPDERKPIERLLRRLQHPEIPQDFWAGVEDHEDGRFVDMELALREVPPPSK